MDQKLRTYAERQFDNKRKADDSSRNNHGHQQQPFKRQNVTKALMREELCPNNELQKLETEFWCHVMVGAGHAAYTDRFHELARLLPHLVTPENIRIRRYIYGLAPQIRGMVSAMEPTTIQSAILKARVLTNEAIRNG
ncbi:hypothetical protein Tco_1521454, partial [Tanacetum coccineum]